MPDPLLDLANFDWAALAAEAESAAPDAGRALAENIMRNLAESVRQSRNALEAAADAPKTLAELYDETALPVTPRQDANIQASFETHLKELFRRTSAAVGRRIEAQEFMGFKPGQPAVRLTLEQYAKQDLANLGPHPHSDLAAVPIPAGYEAELPFAERLAHLTPGDQAKWLGQYQAALAQKREIPPFP